MRRCFKTGALVAVCTNCDATLWPIDDDGNHAAHEMTVIRPDELGIVIGADSTGAPVETIWVKIITNRGRIGMIAIDALWEIE